MKNIKKLSKEELVKLKQEIDNRLKIIKIKSTKPKKGTILSLKDGDKILGIRLSFGGHRLAEPKELIGEVDAIDYCAIDGVDLRGNSDEFRITISHPEIPMGISTTLLKERYKDEHCLLIINTMKSGYDAFYTLKPKTWKQDLKRMYDKHLKNIERYYQEELGIYEKKLNIFLESEEKINDSIG